MNVPGCTSFAEPALEPPGDPSWAKLGGCCCVISHKRFHRVSGRYCSDGGFNKYIEMLSGVFDRLILAVPVDHGPPPSGLNPLADGLAAVEEVPTFKHRYPFQSLLHPIAAGRPMWKAIRQADVVHIVVPGHVQLFGLLLSQLQRKPVFVTIVGDWEAFWDATRPGQQYPRLVSVFKAIHRCFLRWILKSGPAFVYGHNLAGHYRRWGGDVVEFGDSTFTEGELRAAASMGALHHPVRLLYVGRLDYKKGVSVLLRAMAGLRGQGLLARLSIVGSGRDEGEFRRLVEELHLAGEVSFLGSMRMGPELWKTYGEHDVLVLPSFTEGIPKVITEAFANGLAVVATRVGGIPDLVGSDNGLLVPPDDVEALTAALATLLKEPELCLRMGRANLEVARKYTIGARARDLAHHLQTRMPRVFAKSG